MPIQRPPPPGRADTDDKKRVILERVLTIWKKNPQLRLGQLVVNHMGGANIDPLSQLFYIEDEDLASLLEKWP